MARGLVSFVSFALHPPQLLSELSSRHPVFVVTRSGGTSYSGLHSQIELGLCGTGSDGGYGSEGGLSNSGLQHPRFRKHLRGAKEGVSSHVWREGRALLCETQLSLCRCTVSMSLCARHFCIQASDQSLSRFLFFSVLMQLRKAERVSFALAFSVSFEHSTFQDLVSQVEIISKTWVLRMARNPLVRLQLWMRLASRIWSRSSNLERRRTLLPSLDDSEDCATPFGFSKNLCYSQHLRLLLPTWPLPQLQNSAKQSLKSQRPCGGQSQYIATQPCMPELLHDDEQQRWKVCTRLLMRSRDSSTL